MLTKLIFLIFTFALAWTQTTTIINMVICSKTPTIPAQTGGTPTTPGTVIWNYDCTQKACIQTTITGSVITTNNAFTTQDECNAACRAGLVCQNPTANLNPIKVCIAPVVMGTRTADETCMGPRSGFSFNPTEGICVATTVQCTDRVTPNFFAKQESCMAFCSEAISQVAPSGTTTTVIAAPNTGVTVSAAGVI